MRSSVIGLGTMGPGIVMTMARAGMDVLAYDSDPDASARCTEQFEPIRLVLDQLEFPDRGDQNNIEIVSSLSDVLVDTEFVLENINESLQLKQVLLAEIEREVPADVVIASDTSGIPISALQDGAATPERVVGMHWSNPPHLIPVIEVVAGTQTSQETINKLTRIVEDLDAFPITIKRDIPGFVENRILYSIMRESLNLVDDGIISPTDLDTCISWGIGYKLAVIGPMSLLDMAGLDLYNSVASYLNKELANNTDVSKYITEKVAEGKFGQKTGEGIFTYNPEGLNALRRLRAERFIAVRQALGL